MPNHVTTLLTAPKHVLDALASEDSAVDFNTVLPYPEALRKLTAEYEVFETQEEADAHNQAQRERNSRLPEYFRHDEDAVHALTREEHTALVAEHGRALDWYSWQSKAWGTKWNAYAIERRSDTLVKFETAWAHPSRIIDKLSQMFPEDTLAIEYADEDTGYNFGAYTVINGDDTQEDLPQEGTSEAKEFAVRVRHGQTLEEYIEEQRAYYDEDEMQEYYGETLAYLESKKAVSA